MNWDNAQAWADKANKNKRHNEPKWIWGCGLNLDFDGDLLTISSRFYQQSEDIFDGSVSFFLDDGMEVFRREFNSRDIDILKKDVEEYVQSVIDHIEQLLRKNMDVFIGPLPQLL